MLLEKKHFHEVSLADLTDIELQTSDIIDIKAFLESMILYQYPSLISAIKNKTLNQHSVDEISSIASSDAMQDEGGFFEGKPIYYGIFQRCELESILNELQQTIKKSGYQKEIPFLLSLISSRKNLHTVSIVYKSNSPHWLFMDINRFPPTAFYSLDLLMKQINFKSYRFFSISAVLPNIASTQIELEVNCSIYLKKKT